MGLEEGRFAQATGYAVATPSVRNLRDLRHRRFGQPVYVTSDHPLIRKGQVATWEKFNVRLAVVKFTDNVLLGYDPSDLLLPTRFDDQGQPHRTAGTHALQRLSGVLVGHDRRAKRSARRTPFAFKPWDWIEF